MNDLIDRQAAIEINRSYHGQMPNEVNHRIWKEINELPSVQPYTEAEIQKMQDLEQAQMDKVYELGYEEGKVSAQPEIVRCKDCKNRGDDDCPMRFIEWVEYDDDGYIEYDDIIHDYTKDDGFCDRAERRTDE